MPGRVEVRGMEVTAALLPAAIWAAVVLPAVMDAAEVQAAAAEAEAEAEDLTLIRMEAVAEVELVRKKHMPRGYSP